jgi:hypothetical protein
MIRLNSTLRLIPAILVFLILALAGQASAVEWRFEVGTVDLPATDESSTFRPVVFRQAYSVPPVVVVLSSSVDGRRRSGYGAGARRHHDRFRVGAGRARW